MAGIRQLRTGKWEVAVYHRQLPKGRKFFTFANETDARAYGKQWDLMVKAGLPLPAQFAEPEVVEGTLGMLLRARANADGVASSDQATIKLLLGEVGSLKLAALNYTWAEAWVRQLKVVKNLSPSSVRKRVGTLSRAIDDYLRLTPGLGLANPLHLLPKRYSSYTNKDAALVRAVGLEPKADVERDRRLEPDEQDRIVAALRGEKRQDRERALKLDHGQALLMMFLVIIYTGLRLKEAYSLRVDQVDLERKVIRAQKSKLWHGKVVFKDVPIQPALFEGLKEWVGAREGHVLLFPFWGDGEPQRAVTNRLSAQFARVFDYATCEGLTEHDLRHEATCRWLELRGRDGAWLFRVEEINRIMGWAPSSKMAQRYASFRGESLASRMWA